MLGFTLSPEQEQLKKTARDFTRNEIIPVAARYDEAEEFPYDVMRKAWEVGLINFEVPQEYGGLGLGALDTILCLEEINYGCSGMATIIAVNGLSCTPLLLAGNDAQKRGGGAAGRVQLRLPLADGLLADAQRPGHFLLGQPQVLTKGADALSVPVVFYLLSLLSHGPRIHVTG